MTQLLVRHKHFAGTCETTPTPLKSAHDYVMTNMLQGLENALSGVGWAVRTGRAFSFLFPTDAGCSASLALRAHHFRAKHVNMAQTSSAAVLPGSREQPFTS